MNKLIIFSLAFILHLISAFAGDNFLYTRERFAPQDIDQIDEILSDFHQKYPDKNILFYVHGRKRNIEKEWKNLALLEESYNVKVVMFHWPAWSSAVSRPVLAAEKSAADLSFVLSRMNEYRAEHREEFKEKKITFLSHSMGNVVVRYYVLNYYREGDLSDIEGNPLFENYISSAADVSMLDHKQWLSNIDFAKKKFVTMNNHDAVLQASYLLDIIQGKLISYKLGLGFETFSIRRFFIDQILDKNSIYIDFSKVIKLEHRYFQMENELLYSIFKPLMEGQDFSAQGLNIEKKKGIFYVKD